MNKDDLEALIMPGLKQKIEISDKIEEKLAELINIYDSDKAARAVLISMLTHYVAELVRANTCCAFHAMEVWGEIGNAVIAGVMPGEEIEWESVSRTDDDGFYVPPPIEKPEKPH